MAYPFGTADLIKLLKHVFSISTGHDHDGVNSKLVSGGATLTGTQTLTGKTLTAPAVNSPNTIELVASHDYAGAAVAWAVSAADAKAGILVVTNANGAVDAVATPTAGRVYTVVNTSGQALTIKATGQTGIVIVSTKTAIVRGNGTDFVRVTADV